VDGIQKFLDKWNSDRSEAKPGRRAGSSATGLDFDVMERVIKLLDRNLFESTMTNEIQDLVNTLDDYHKTIQSVFSIIGKVVDFHVGCLHLAGLEDREFHFFINKSVDQAFLSEIRKEVVSHLVPLDILLGQADEEEFVHDPMDLLLEPGPQPDEILSSITYTLLTKGKPSGVIALAAAEEDAFAERSTQIFEIISRQANIVIDYACLYEKTKKLSITDGLTQIYNHRYFQEQLRREFDRSQRKETPLSLIMLDIDHFKHFNDTFGHQQGDIVLKDLARLLQSQIRTCDLLARYGGEEFAIIMPEAEDKVCLVAAERLRKAVESHSIPGRDKELKVTISMGVATVPREDIPGPPDLINAADRALYGAKESGRNRVQC
jgi:diguanylate cyclase (GGDEF)-like protein